MFSKDPFDRERYEHVRSVAADILASCSDLDPGLIRDLLRGERGYATPKVDVRGAVFHAHRVLLVRERSDGLWTLSGGCADWPSLGAKPPGTTCSYAGNEAS